jgi:hypothetical protein
VTARDRARIRQLVDRRKREQMAKARGRELHVPRWDDERAWALVERVDEPKKAA